ncbi:hypothetical protein H072_5742 [Dactylellina haptotyla CBS 200.50]|uniref:Uncharacterized protein n=1 Tax=Dactylellina haptotyla (strain CBS 200.50) TaxID=1284197 RepID=S8ABT5_DACHA|nr:hypothetical protein H072_5742 [Dactylellina haptotyla CBS 200.50]
MCRYRVYIYSCGDAEVENPPYLPCSDEYCAPDSPDADPPIKIKKTTPCGQHAAGGSPTNGQPTDGGTSWSRTNSSHRGRALGPGEGDPGDRLRHTVSTKIKVSKLVRSLTKKKPEKEHKNNGADGFLPDNHRAYDEIGSEMDELKK